VNNISLNDFIHINSIDSNKPPAMTGVCVCVCVFIHVALLKVNTLKLNCL